MIRIAARLRSAAVLCLLAALLLLTGPRVAAAEELLVFAAASLKNALDQEPVFDFLRGDGGIGGHS